MWNPPTKIEHTYKIQPVGKLEIGIGTYGGGMTVGLAPVMARILVPDTNYFPTGWFVIQQYKTLHRTKMALDEAPVYNGEMFLPDWLRADCFEYHYKQMRYQA